MDQELAKDPEQKHLKYWQAITKAQAQKITKDIFEGILDEGDVEEEISRIQEINKTMLQMSKDKGYKVSFSEAEKYVELGE